MSKRVSPFRASPLHALFAAPVLAIALAACEAEEGPAPIAPDTVNVMAKAETAPVASGDDAADDPAIWVNPDDPLKSLIVGTDKKNGLVVYDLSGAIVY